MLAQLVDDALAMAGIARTLEGVDASRIVTWGEGLGGRLSLACAALVPGVAFEAEGYCRLSYAVSMENINKGLDRIEEFVRSLD